MHIIRPEPERAAHLACKVQGKKLKSQRSLTLAQSGHNNDTQHASQQCSARARAAL